MFNGVYKLLLISNVFNTHDCVLMMMENYAEHLNDASKTAFYIYCTNKSLLIVSISYGDVILHCLSCIVIVQCSAGSQMTYVVSLVCKCAKSTFL